MTHEYRVELRDISGALKNRIEHESTQISWRYDRIGGCGPFQIQTSLAFDSSIQVTADWDVRIYIQNPETSDFDLWYRGFVEDVERKLAAKEQLNIRGTGYVGQIDRVLITQTFSVTEVASIVADVMVAVASKTSITFDGPNDVTVTGVTAQTIEFKATPAGQAINQLAELTGTREWGIDRTSAFFFHTRRDGSATDLTSADKLIYSQQQAIDSITTRDRFREVINAVTVEGGKNSSDVTIVTESVNSGSQIVFGRREKRVGDSALVNSADTTALGDAIVAELNIPRQETTFRVNMDRNLTLVESEANAGSGEVTRVIGLLKATSAVLYGQKVYGSFKYNGLRFFNLVKADYVIGRQGQFVTVNAGEAGQTAEGFAAKVAGEINAVRQRGL